MKNKTFNNILDEMRELHDKKSSDYASDSNLYSNFEFAAHLVSQFSDPVDQVFVCLIGIKIARLGQLLSGKKPKNESVEDSLRDLPTYCTIWASYHKDKKDRDPRLAFFEAGAPVSKARIDSIPKGSIIEKVKEEYKKDPHF